MSSVVILSTIKMYKGNSAGSARVMNIARALAENENEVYLYSSRLNKNLQRVSQVESGIYVVGEDLDGSSIIAKIIRRLLPLIVNFCFVLRARKEINSNYPDAAILVYPQPATSMELAALLIFKALGMSKMFLDVNEVRTAELHNLSFSPNPVVGVLQRTLFPFKYLKFFIQECLSRYYDGLIAISTKTEEYFRKFNPNIIRVPILTNVADKPFVNAPIYRKNGKFLICFTGSVYLMKEGLDTFYKALSALNARCPDFEFHLYGPILKHESVLILETLPKRYDLLNKVIYHGVVDQGLLPSILSKHHLLVLPRPLTAQTNYGFSTKLAEYMVSGVPVLVTDVSDNCIYVHDGINGFVVPPNDVQKMSEKIEYIMLHYDQLSSFVIEGSFETAKDFFYYSRYGKALNEFIS